MDAIQESMKMTSFGGEAKSLALQAIRLSRSGQHDKAEEHMKQAEQSLLLGHESHMKLLSYDAEHEDLKVTIFMVHAADHLNAAETIYSLATEIMALHGGKQDV